MFTVPFIFTTPRGDDPMFTVFTANIPVAMFTVAAACPVAMFTFFAFNDIVPPSGSNGNKFFAITIEASLVLDGWSLANKFIVDVLKVAFS